MGWLVRSASLGATVALIATACSTGGAASTAGDGSSPLAATNAASPSAPASGTSGGAGQASAACSGEDAASALKAAASAQLDAGSYRVSGTTSAGGQEQQYTLEVAKPDSVHVILGEIEFIAVGGMTWRKSGGQWEAAPGVDLSTLTAGMGQLNQELLDRASFSDVSVDQNAQVDGQAAVLYRYHESIPSELEADSQMWLDPPSCRPIKNVATSTASNAVSHIDVRYSDWGSVTIQPPA
jgi:hypothetical protein